MNTYSQSDLAPIIVRAIRIMTPWTSRMMFALGITGAFDPLLLTVSFIMLGSAIQFSTDKL